MTGKHRKPYPAKPLVPVAAGATAVTLTMLVTALSSSPPPKPVATHVMSVEPVRFAYPPFTPSQAALYLPPLAPPMAPLVSRSSVEESIKQTSYTEPTVKVAGTTGGIAARAVSAALGMRGVPYSWGGTSRSGVDCSGLTQLAYRAAGVSLPRVAAAQASVGRSVRLSDIAPGDLLFYAYGGGISHVAMSIGNGMIVEASQPGQPVATRLLYTDHLSAIRRIL